MTAVAVQRKEEILQRMAHGEPLTKIAKDLGYASHSGIIERIGSDPAYALALKTGIVAKLEKREGELEGAEDNVTVTRADRLLGHARWWAERLNPAMFGQKQEVTHTHQVTVDAGLVGLASDLLKGRKERVIEHGECSAAIPYIPSDEDGNKQGDA
jgi:hypothetical protein